MLLHKSIIHIAASYLAISFAMNQLLINPVSAMGEVNKTVLLVLKVDENSIQLSKAYVKSFPFRAIDTEAISNGYHYDLLLNNQVVYKGAFYDPLNRMDGGRVSEDGMVLKLPYFGTAERLLFKYKKMDKDNILYSGEFEINLQE